MFDDSLVSYTLEVCEDDIPVRGNAMATGDDDYDREVEDEILARLNDGDVWAWACVKVTARYDDVVYVEGVDYLGACCYADEDDFKHCGYYADMCDQARESLYTELEGILARFGCVDPAGSPECVE